MNFCQEAYMKQIILILALLILGGCVTLPTAPGVPVSPADGKPFDRYLEEDATCRQIAERQLGKYYEYYSSQEAQYHYDNVYLPCMLSHGNKLIQTPVVYREYFITPPQE